MPSEVRQRPGKAPAPSGSARPVKGAKPSSGGVSILDIGRSIVFLFLTSCLLSWFITGKDFFWGHRPQYTHVSFWQDLVVSTADPSLHSHTDNPTERHPRSSLPDRCATDQIRWLRPRNSHLPGHQRLHLRCYCWPPLLRSRRLIFSLLRRRRYPRLCYILLRRSTSHT